MVLEAAAGQVTDELSIQWTDVSATILHFCPEWGAQGDLDNIAKPILDALIDAPNYTHQVPGAGARSERHVAAPSAWWNVSSGSAVTA